MSVVAYPNPPSDFWTINGGPFSLSCASSTLLCSAVCASRLQHQCPRSCACCAVYLNAATRFVTWSLSALHHLAVPFRSLGPQHFLSCMHASAEAVNNANRSRPSTTSMVSLTTKAQSTHYTLRSSCKYDIQELTRTRGWSCTFTKTTLAPSLSSAMLCSMSHCTKPGSMGL